MNRREFIKGGALAAAALMGGASALAQGTLFGKGNNQCEEKPIRKGISLGMIQEGKTALEKFQIAKDCGIDGLELTAPADDESLKAWVAASEATGVQVAGIMFGGNWSKNLSSPDPEARKEAIALITKALEQGRELQAPHVLVVPGVVNAGMDYEAAWKNSLEGFRELAPVAEKNKVKIGVENVWNNFLISPVEMAHYIDQINSPWIGCLFDIGNIVRYGWPEHWVRALNRRIVNLHIKGFSSKLADTKGNWSGFGVEMTDEGDFDWKPVAQALKDIRYHGWLIAEVGGGKRERVQDISNRLEKMSKLIAEAK